MAAAPTANTRAFLLVRANVVDLDDPCRFFIFISIETREYLFRSKRENNGELCGCAFPLSLSLSLSLSLAHPSSSSTKRERSNALFFYSLRTSFPGREGENINRLIFS
jgi:hypothetical protein